MFNVYKNKNQPSRQTGSRNLMGPKTLPKIWGTYMKLVTKYQISAINSCWEKCDEKCAYMFNVYKNQLSRQTGSGNLTGPKTLPTIWYTYSIWRLWPNIWFLPSTVTEKNATKNILDRRKDGRMEGRKDGRMEGRTDRRTDGQTDRGKTVYPLPPRGSGGIINIARTVLFILVNLMIIDELKQLTKVVRCWA